jgi:hypothetical protein
MRWQHGAAGAGHGAPQSRPSGRQQRGSAVPADAGGCPRTMCSPKAKKCCPAQVLRPRTMCLPKVLPRPGTAPSHHVPAKGPAQVLRPRTMCLPKALPRYCPAFSRPMSPAPSRPKNPWAKVAMTAVLMNCRQAAGRAGARRACSGDQRGLRAGRGGCMGSWVRERQGSREAGGPQGHGGGSAPGRGRPCRAQLSRQRPVPPSPNTGASCSGHPRPGPGPAATHQRDYQGHPSFDRVVVH